jgi:hypothetical protein
MYTNHHHNTNQQFTRVGQNYSESESACFRFFDVLDDFSSLDFLLFLAGDTSSCFLFFESLLPEADGGLVCLLYSGFLGAALVIVSKEGASDLAQRSGIRIQLQHWKYARTEIISEHTREGK